ncbi:MAG TPA: N-acetylmuramoyl-L-alanine amidase, partial [Hyphomicrobiaceae bacterium]
MTLKPDTALVGAVRPSPNFGPRRSGLRPSILLLHYTGVVTAARAIDWLTRTESNVSCHYVIDEAGAVSQLVAEEMRAWHAGLAMWAGESDINSASIGIEIQN